MSSKSTETRYGSVAIAIHWASAAAVILAFAAGTVVANSNPVPTAPLVAHIVLGLSVLVLTVLRIIWWAVADKHPSPPKEQPRWQRMAANATHGLLYVILILMASSGIMTLISSGAIPVLLAGGALPDLSAVIPRIAHGIMSKLLLALFVVHLGAALYHQFVRQDHLLARMGIGRA
ncbi:MAG: cytochrome b/b6 domain-containing protein [Devosia sp.]